MFHWLLWLLLTALVSACAVQLGSEIQSGRSELLAGKPAVALSHFRKAADVSPDYVTDFTPLRQGIWTYVGRSYYGMGRLSEARHAFNQALTRNESDFMARLYLGLTRLRQPGTSASGKSFSLSDIIYALKERVTSKRLTALVKERGVNFELTAETEKSLRSSGAESDLIEQIRTRSESASRSEENAQQALKETAQALLEADKWFERIAATAQGRFWDPAGKIRSHIKRQLVLIATPSGRQPELISNLEWIGNAIEEEIDLARRDEREQAKNPQR